MKQHLTPNYREAIIKFLLSQPRQTCLVKKVCQQLKQEGYQTKQVKECIQTDNCFWYSHSISPTVQLKNGYLIKLRPEFIDSYLPPSYSSPIDIFKTEHKENTNNISENQQVEKRSSVIFSKEEEKKKNKNPTEYNSKQKYKLFWRKHYNKISNALENILIDYFLKWILPKIIQLPTKIIEIVDQVRSL